MKPTLLIVEESLRDFKAHWFEYIKTIAAAAECLGYQVEVACHCQAAPEIQQQFKSFPIFRYARYLDNQRQKLLGERYYGFILHSIRSLRVLWPLLNRRDRSGTSTSASATNNVRDHIFVPTVLIHHLLAWWIVMKFHPCAPKHLTLFFVANPGLWDSTHQISYIPKSPMVKIQRLLLRLFSPMIGAGTVTFGVETRGAKKEFERLTDLPFHQFPHPVPPLIPAVVDSDRRPGSLFACYGFARYEKGSDLLKAMIEQVLCKDTEDSESQPSWPQFCIQWVDPFLLPDGRECDSTSLTQYSKVELINRPLMSKEYQSALAQTSCMLLPYRNSSYYARLSRIAIESISLGIPVIYTQGGWLEEVVEAFGAGIGIRDENVEDLIAATMRMTEEYQYFQQQALEKREQARTYFSGESFCRQLFHTANKTA